MNIASLYALSAGQKLDKIHTLEKFYPLPFENKYIVIQPYSKPSKTYSFWPEVIEFIHPTLEKHGYKLVQVGGKDEAPLNNCYHTQGTTNWGQLQYLIANCEMVICVDSVSAHLAGHYNKKLVDLISNNFRACVEPFYGDKDKQIILEPDRTNRNPSFLLDEGPKKQVDEIKIEQVVESIGKLLNLEFPKINSIHFGDNYNSPTIEFSPDCPFTLQIPANQIIQIRLDYLNELTPINHQYALQLAAQRKVLIYTDKPFNLDPFKQVRPNIAAIVYKLQESGHNAAKSGQEENVDEINFVKSLKRGGFQFRVVKEYSNAAKSSENEVDLATLTPEQIAELKFKYLDVAPIQFVEKKKVELDFVENMMYISKRLIFSNNLIYRSKNNFKKGLTNNENQTKILDNQELKELQEEADYLYIFQKQSNN